MSACIVVPVRVRGRPGFVWRWRRSHDGCMSECCFELFYACMQDAIKRGMTVDMPGTIAAARHPVTIASEEFRPASPEASSVAAR